MCDELCARRAAGTGHADLHWHTGARTASASLSSAALSDEARKSGASEARLAIEIGVRRPSSGWGDAPREPRGGDPEGCLSDMRGLIRRIFGALGCESVSRPSHTHHSAHPGLIAGLGGRTGGGARQPDLYCTLGGMTGSLGNAHRRWRFGLVALADGHTLAFVFADRHLGDASARRPVRVYARSQRRNRQTGRARWGPVEGLRAMRPRRRRVKGTASRLARREESASVQARALQWRCRRSRHAPTKLYDYCI
jgi:hypothetical protein